MFFSFACCALPSQRSAMMLDVTLRNKNADPAVLTFYSDLWLFVFFYAMTIFLKLDLRKNPNITS